MHGMIEFFSNHLVLAALTASGLWFYAGHQDVVKGRYGTGLSWQIIGVVILGLYALNAAVSRSWISLMIAIAGVTIELWLIRRFWRERQLGSNATH